MPYNGYLEVGGREIANAARTFHYVSTLAPAFGLHDCQDCGDLGEALGETYTTPEGDDAPWFDPSDPSTAQFYGFYPLAIEGLTSSTRESINVELVGNGSVQTSQRRTGRDLMVRGLMYGETHDALDKGFSWLDNTLNSEGCTGDRATIFSACPEVVEYPPSAFQINIPDDHSWSVDAAEWSSTSGTIVGNGTLDFTWDSDDAEKAAWRRITGLIPGERYQLRLKMDGGPTKVSLGNNFVTPDSNFAKNPRWLGSPFDGSLISPTPPENQFDVSDGGPLGQGWRKLVYPQDTAADAIFVADVDEDLWIDVMEGQELTYSAYAYTSEPFNVELVVIYLDSLGAQVGADVVVDTDVSNDTWVQLSGAATTPVNAVHAQVMVRYTTANPITAGTEFGVWGTLASPNGSTTYFDGYSDGYVWTGVPDASTSEIDADIEWVTYWDFDGVTWDPPIEPTVLDFSPRSQEVTLYIRSGSGNLRSIEVMRVWRVPNPGVIAFSTNHLDMVPPSDGWQHDPVTDTLITSQIVEVQNARYSGALRIAVTSPDGGATVGATTGPYRQSFGLSPGVRYRLAIDYSVMYDGAVTPGEPFIDGAISQNTVYSADNDIGNHVQSYRVVEFIPGDSSVTVRFELGADVLLGVQESVTWQIGEVLVEEAFEGPDTSDPDPLQHVTRTLYSVGAISGPDMTNLQRTSCGWMAQVTLGLRAGNPGIFREPVLAGGLPTSVSMTQEAIPCIDGQQARVNFMYNPSVEVALQPVVGRDDYLASGGTITRENSGGPGAVVGEWFVQAAGSTQIVGYYRVPADGLLPISGNTYTHSVYVSADVSGTYDWTLGLNYQGSVGEIFQDSVLVTANEWTRIVNTFTIPLGNELDVLEFHIQDNSAISTALYMDGYMLEPGSTAGTVWDDTFTGVEWSGTDLESALLLPATEEDITADPDCPVVPLPPAPPVVDVACVEEPAAYQRSVITISENVVPTNLTAFPVLTLQAGAQDVRQARIRFWENPDHLTIDELDPCGFDGDIIVSYLPAGATLVIDGVQRIATMTLNGVTQDATHLLYGSDGGPVDWPELTGGIEYLVALDLDSAGAHSDTQMNVELVVMD